MSAVADRMLRPDAIKIARAFVDAIEDCTERLVVAGSLRRRLAMIGDVEVVAVPKVERVVGGLFEDQERDVDLLAARMQDLLDQGRIERRLDKNLSPRWGPTLRYLLFQGARVDLFTPSDDRFGWILLLRTGPAAFSRQLVVERGRRTKDNRPGLLPPLIVPRDGRLTWRVSGERIETSSERDIFELFNLPYQEPWERS
jgi:DNA polymerase/3'-5' exonuclease PolX